MTEKSDDSRARRAAKRAGLMARKTRWRSNSIDNHGSFMLIDPRCNAIIAGERFNLSPDDVREICAERLH